MPPQPSLREALLVLPTMPISYTFPFMGFLALVASACFCSVGTQKVHPALTSPSPTIFQDRNQHMGGAGSKEWARLFFLLLYSILKVTLHYCAGSIWLVGPLRWLGG